MPYTLQRLAPGSYDLCRNGVLIGSVVRDVAPEGSRKGWQAELLGEVLRARRPPPFTELEHWFPSWEALLDWLGQPCVDEGEGSA